MDQLIYKEKTNERAGIEVNNRNALIDRRADEKSLVSFIALIAALEADNCCFIRLPSAS